MDSNMHIKKPKIYNKQYSKLDNNNYNLLFITELPT